MKLRGWCKLRCASYDLSGKRVARITITVRPVHTSREVRDAMVTAGFDLMIRTYNLEETQWGFEIVGPHGHKWVCANGEARTRAAALAKAFERAHVEGQSDITNNEDLLLILTNLALLSAAPSESEIQRIALLKSKAQQLLRHIERLRFVAGRSNKKAGEKVEGSRVE